MSQVIFSPVGEKKNELTHQPAERLIWRVGARSGYGL